MFRMILILFISFLFIGSKLENIEPRYFGTKVTSDVINTGKNKLIIRI